MREYFGCLLSLGELLCMHFISKETHHGLTVWPCSILSLLFYLLNCLCLCNWCCRKMPAHWRLTSDLSQKVIYGLWGAKDTNIIISPGLLRNFQCECIHTSKKKRNTKHLLLSTSTVLVALQTRCSSSSVNCSWVTSLFKYETGQECSKNSQGRYCKCYCKKDYYSF